MPPHKSWGLGAKLALIGAPFLLLALLSTAATLWVSWQLEGGAAAVNEAGRMRMQSYRMALSIGTGESGALAEQVKEFDKSLAALRNGDPERPLFVPWDKAVSTRFITVEQDWRHFRALWIDGKPSVQLHLRDQTVTFASHIDDLVTAIESHMSHWTTMLHMLQLSMFAMAILGATVLIYTGNLFVMGPIGQLKHAIKKIQSGDFDARVEQVTSDEFGTLAEGFNGMAEHLQSMYRNLERKVTEKTAELEEKHERLENLYEVTALVAKATSLDELAQGFTKNITRISRADGVALRWSDQTNQRYLMLAAEGLPSAMVEAERCLDKGDCHCGTASPLTGLRVIPIHELKNTSLKHCTKAGFETVVSIPVYLHDKLMGEIDLFFRTHVNPSLAERSLLEALSSHLAGAIENLRLNALEKEAAVSQERHLLAGELHDSIAQSLAFLKIQVQLMRDAVQSGDSIEIHNILEEIDLGVRESYADVRELLLHFRTRTNTEDIEPALATTLRKFEHQSGIKAILTMQGQGMPLLPDLQIQVLHIVQEALSNVRKHARASQVWLDVQQQPEWRFKVSDNGIGFIENDDQLDETHVGLRIMTERAQRIGAGLKVISTPGHGSAIILTLPQPAHPLSTASNVTRESSITLA
jgi:two-component system nitrate/nitrite sensor histidine kinase NarX